MKLKKVIKYLENYGEVALVLNDETIWTGSIVDLHVAVDKNKDRKQYFKDCRKGGDLEAISKAKKAKKFLNYKLDTSGDDNAAIFVVEEGKFIIHLTEDEDKKKGI